MGGESEEIGEIITKDVAIRSSQASNEPTFSFFLCFIANGEFVPTRESSCFDSIHRISLTFKDIINCW